MNNTGLTVRTFSLCLASSYTFPIWKLKFCLTCYCTGAKNCCSFASFSYCAELLVYKYCKMYFAVFCLRYCFLQEVKCIFVLVGNVQCSQKQQLQPQVLSLFVHPFKDLMSLQGKMLELDFCCFYNPKS